MARLFCFFVSNLFLGGTSKEPSAVLHFRKVSAVAVVVVDADFGTVRIGEQNSQVVDVDLVARFPFAPSVDIFLHNIFGCPFLHNDLLGLFGNTLSYIIVCVKYRRGCREIMLLLFGENIQTEIIFPSGNTDHQFAYFLCRLPKERFFAAGIIFGHRAGGCDFY